MSTQNRDAKESTESSGNSRAQDGSNTRNTRSLPQQSLQSLADPRERVALALLYEVGWSYGELAMTFQVSESSISDYLGRSSTVLYCGGEKFHRLLNPDGEGNYPRCRPAEGEYKRVPREFLETILGLEECANCWERRVRP